MGNSALVYLSDEKGEKRTLANFVPEPEDGGEAIFYFPRNDASGKPLLGADSDKLIFNFTIRFNRDEDGYIAPGAHVSMFDGMEFKARDLVRNGKVIF